MQPKHSDGETANLSSEAAPRRLMKKKRQKPPEDLNIDIPRQATRLVYLCASSAVGIALLSLIGWMTGVRMLAGQWGNLIPMAPLTALSFLLFGSALFSHARWPVQRISRLFVLAAVSIIAFFALIMLGQFVTGIDLGMEKALFFTNQLVGQIPIGRMSPITAISFLLESTAFFILLFTPMRRKSLVIAALLVVSAIGINLIILVGYAYGAPLLYGGTAIPVALFTAITFVLLGVGQISLLLPGLPELQRWNRTTFRGMLLRAFLPFIVVFTLLEGWVNTIFISTMIDPVVFHSLAALVASVLAVVIIGWISERTGAAFEQAQAQISNLARFPDENLNPVLRVASDGRLLYANPSSQRLLNFWKCRQPGDVLPKGQRRLMEAIFTRGVVQREEISCGKIIYELIYIPFQGLDYLNIYGSDITGRKRVETALRDSESELQALFATMKDIVIVYNKEGRYLKIATPGSQLLIKPPEDLLGKTIHEVFPKEEADRFIHLIKTVLDTQRTMPIEYSLEIDHHKIWFDASVSPMQEDTVIWVARDITERKLMEEESHFIGIHDSLTKLYNRTFFEEELSRLEKSRLFPISIFMIDVDGLKIINDTQGHAVGDELLQRLAQALQKSFRPEDMVARIGGDEFVIVLPMTKENAAHLALKRINHFLELNSHNKNNNSNAIKISIGIATCDKQGSLLNTFKKADDLMYLDKRSKG